MRYLCKASAYFTMALPLAVVAALFIYCVVDDGLVFIATVAAGAVCIFILGGLFLGGAWLNDKCNEKYGKAR